VGDMLVFPPPLWAQKWCLLETSFFYGTLLVGPTHAFPSFYDRGGNTPGESLRW
jgi:hypothetical protein